MGFQKNSNRELKMESRRIFRFVTFLENFRQNKALPMEILQNCVKPVGWKFQGKKNKTHAMMMEIADDFFLITSLEIPLVLFNSRNLHIPYSFNTPGNSISLTPSPLFGFFWNKI